MDTTGQEKPLRVGINAISLLSPLTGIGQYTLQLARAVESENASVSCFYGLGWSSTPPAVQAAGKDSDEQRVPMGFYTVAKHLVKALVPSAYDVVRFVQQRRFSATVKDRMLDVYHDPNFIPFRFDGPTVITVHDLSVLTLPHSHPRARVRAIGKRLDWAIQHADAIITVSEFVRSELLARFDCPAEKVVAVHNGVNPHYAPMNAEATKPALSRLGLEHGRYLLGVGTFEPRKNLQRLCSAYRQLPQELRRRYPLVLAGARGWGEADFADDLKRLEREGCLKRSGYLSEADLASVYSGALVFVYPSIYEGFGLPVVEAMAAGVPVVTSDRSSLPEVAGDAARLVDPFDEDSIAGAVRELLEDEAARDALVMRGLQRAAVFSWERAARETLAVYRMAMQRRTA